MYRIFMRWSQTDNWWLYKQFKLQKYRAKILGLGLSISVLNAYGQLIVSDIVV